jgi:hypothetical protein
MQAKRLRSEEENEVKNEYTNTKSVTIAVARVEL